MRKAPFIKLQPCEDAWLAASGWDTVQEAMAFKPSLAWIETLKQAKQCAADLQDDLLGIIPLQCGPELLNCHATGAKGGFSYRLTNEDFIIMVGSPRRDWTISVRYLSAGLWAHGLDSLRDRVFACLRETCEQRTLDCVRVSRADWCFDFYAPNFFRDFRPGEMSMNSCTPPQTKKIEDFIPDTYGEKGQLFFAQRVETFTMGAKTGCQVQCYDKTLEIDEMSGKTWLYDVWKAGLGFDPWGNARPDNMVRIECRFSADFLKERNLRRPFELMEHRAALVAEALIRRRLLDVRAHCDDTNKARRPVHPMWSEAFRQAAVDHLVPVGRKVTGRRSELIDQGLKQLAGLLRNCSVLTVGADDSDTRAELIKRAMEILESDPQHKKKVDRAMDRYAAVDFAR